MKERTAEALDLQASLANVRLATGSAEERRCRKHRKPAADFTVESLQVRRQRDGKVLATLIPWKGGFRREEGK